MGWAAGFEAGNRMGQGIIDSYNEGDRRRKEEELAAYAKGLGDRVQQSGMSDVGGLKTNDAEYAKQIAADNAFINEGTPQETSLATTVATAPAYTREQYYNDLAAKAAGLNLSDRADKYGYMAGVEGDRMYNRGREAKADTRADTESGWKKDDRARDQAVKQGVADIYKKNAEAQDGLEDQSKFTGNIASLVKGQGLEAAIRKSAGPNATPDEISAAIDAYRNALGTAETQKRAANQQGKYSELANLYGGIGQDPEKAEAFRKLSESEGITKGIELLKRGDLDAFNRTFNGSGDIRGVVKSTGKDKKSGDLIAEFVDPYSGQSSFVNVSDYERRMISLGDKAKLKELDSKAVENYAQANAANAAAGASTAHAGLLNAQKDEFKSGLKKPKYVVQGSEVQSSLGTPAVDDKGQPLADPMTGRQLINRNVKEEQRFYKWMQDNGITDTNEALAKWQAGARNIGVPTATRTRTYDPTRGGFVEVNK